jgi:hypothetical protein
MRFLRFAVALLAIGATLDIAAGGAVLEPASGATQSMRVHPYCWNNAAHAKKCTFDDMSECEVYSQDAVGWCGINAAYSGSLPPLKPYPDGW